MKKLLFITIISLAFVSMIAFPVFADKASPKLALEFTDLSEEPVDDDTNLMLNQFVIVSQELLDKASPILAKAVDKSSPKLLRVDKSTPQLMKEYNKSSPILMKYGKGWIDLAEDINSGHFTAIITGTDVSGSGQIEIISDGLTTSISSSIDVDGDMNQTITMTFDKSKNAGSIIYSGRGGFIWGTAGYEFYRRFSE